MNRIHLPKVTSRPLATKRMTGNGLLYGDSPQFSNGTNWVETDRASITYNFDEATHVARTIFTAHRAIEVLAIRCVHTVAGGSGAAIQPRKCTGTQAPSAGAVLTAATILLSGTADTVLTPALTATAASLVLAAGNRIAVTPAGTLTSLAGASLTIEYRYL